MQMPQRLEDTKLHKGINKVAPPSGGPSRGGQADTDYTDLTLSALRLSGICILNKIKCNNES
jgi:hypothetical protein